MQLYNICPKFDATSERLKQEKPVLAFRLKGGESARAKCYIIVK